MSQLDKLYTHGFCCPDHGNDPLTDTVSDLSYIDGEWQLAKSTGINLGKIVSRVIRSVFDRKIVAGDLDEELYQFNKEKLFNAIKVGGIALDLDEGDEYYDLGEKIKKSAMTFVAFKNHSNLMALIDALTDEAGKLRTWAQFNKAAKGISKNYNKNWLAAEYRTSVKSVRMSKIWQRIERDKERKPWLIYKTQNDSNVRDSHQLMHNVCKRVDDPFWDEFYPPNGWRCRCYTRQRSTFKGIEEPEAYPDEKQMPKAFRVNTGKTGDLYSKDHPYFKDVSDDHRANIIDALYSFD